MRGVDLLARSTVVIGATLLTACAGGEMASGTSEVALATTSALAPAVQAFFDGCVDTAPDYAGAEAVFAAAGIPLGDRSGLKHPVTARLEGDSCAVALTGAHKEQLSSAVDKELARRIDDFEPIEMKPGGYIGYAANYPVGGAPYYVAVSNNIRIAGQRATSMLMYPKRN